MRFGERIPSPDHGLTVDQQEIGRWLFKKENKGVEKGKQLKFKVHREAEARGLEAPPAWVKINMEAAYRDKHIEQMVVREFVDLVLEQFGEGKLPFDVVIGVPEGATGFAAGVADQLVFGFDQKVLALVIAKPKSGPFKIPKLEEEEKPKRVLLVEDVITTGKSTADLAQALQDAGYEVVLAVGLVDREQGGPERLAKLGIPTKTAFTLDQLLRFGLYEDGVDLNRAEYNQMVGGEKEMNIFRSKHNL